ncbi:Lysine biosynthesis regulatory protein LYS14 [Fusarium odoratissimum]|uniref:Lysine biosynthesis regulatory protein LYS14 n=1 Tax=Fusarium oxysporum f. sp. cubense (strain race 4) TaxID=2502994 RepID=N1RK95_FUSC4|nr:Lysine biosynthesis regulatory protein LYS14 [Fusarium odoratissimum]EMT67020.1 Lysine biosynthesis regulatory protein LYS14 [Fusarium odoratissimum]
MTGKRSRKGCGECRKRRRKCDEVKPSCGQCVSNHRSCKYELRLVWSQGVQNRRSGMRVPEMKAISLTDPIK